MTEVRIGYNANTETNLLTYRVYFGLTSGVYTAPGSPRDLGLSLTGGFEIFESGTYFVNLRAVNTSGQESPFATEINRFHALGVGLGKAN